MAVRQPCEVNRWAIRRVVVVLPLVPVTATSGMRPSWPGANSSSTMGTPTLRGLPKDGARCMRRPGAALTSTMPPFCSSSGRSMVSQTTSTPQMCRPMVWAASTARAAMSGCTSSVTSVALPPVDRLALLRSTTRWPWAGTDSGVSPSVAMRAMAMSSRRILVSAVPWPEPRRGSWLTMSTSSRMVCWPSPSTWGGSRRAAATNWPPTTSRRKSWPGRKRSTMMSSPNSEAVAKAALSCSCVVMLTTTPLPWLPSWGLTTTGRPTSWATSQASSTSLTGRPSGTGTPAACSRRLVRSLSWAMDSATALVWSSSAAWMRRALEPQPSCTSEPEVRRRMGMPRATAASTMEPVEGPMRSSSSSSRSWATTLSASKGVSARADCSSSPACSMARRPTASSVYSTTTW